MFNPDEIIFASTSECNLHCKHCFVNRTKKQLSIEAAKKFIDAYIYNTSTFKLSQTPKIGFSGGEPFLYIEFITEITKHAVKNDLMFDQIMTNGDWWKGTDDLYKKLKLVFDAGYDGKIGLSWDSYHGQDSERIKTFIKAVQEIFGKDSINIQTVIYDSCKYKNKNELNADTEEVYFPEINAENYDFLEGISVYTLPRTFTSKDKRAWQAKHWFKDDFCEGPGNIFYIHPDGNIAPCCGFANENAELFIGNISDSFEKIMQNAQSNKMVKICYEEGLAHYRKHGLKKILHARKKKLCGKCSDICSFCDFLCKENLFAF